MLDRSPVSEPTTILTIFGTRPEVIKLAPVLRQIDLYPDDFRSVVVSSDQHTDLLAPFVKLLKLRVDHHLNAMRPGQPLNHLLANVIRNYDDVLLQERPSLVLIQGDTTTALAGALGAFHRGIAVGHVEAGLRTGDPLAPFPEEMNRRLISRIAALHFAATPRNRQALLAEGVAESQIVLTGNPVVDALEYMGKEVQPSPRLAALLQQTHGLRRIALTTHRRENFGDTMVGHLQVLRRFVETHPDTAVIFPVHPNPNVRKSAESVLGGMPRIHLTEPLDYGDFVALMSRSRLIASDSGGVQEEAPSLGVPLIVLREKTERPEAVEAGVAKLAGTPERFAELLEEVHSGRFTVRAGDNPFGQGDAAQRIVQAIRMSLRLPTPVRTFAEITR